MKDPDFKRGFDHGRKAARHAYELAQVDYDCSLNEIKAQ